ncbi:MAG: Fic family protein [Clostridia bacterium]|nr:Fic family protein [Clostridia bacterium]MBQ8584126.1 Fic family protein [Clostridia bacterium]
MAYSLNPSTDNCYEGTSCLVNKLGIYDEGKLSEVEAQITFAKAVMLEENPIEGNFDFEHFKKIHEFLFCDLYEWAGCVRSVDISKKRTRFLRASSIEEIAAKCFQKVGMGYFSNLSFDSFVERIAEFYNDVNYIHPFREGNGRAERAYFTQLIRSYGYNINFSEVDTDELMIATIQASQGVNDYLVEFFKKAITQKK